MNTTAIRCRVDDLKSNARNQVSKVQTSMHTSPMKWLGVAAGTGFGLGLLGRLMQARAKRRHPTLDLVIIDSGC